MATIHSQSDLASSSGVHRKFPQISGFTILESLYEGTQCSIYRARQDRLGRTVALKLMPEWPLPSDVALERFNRAAYVMAQVPNPGLCTLFDTGVRDGYYFTSMEFVSGQTLQRQLAQVPNTDESFAISVGLQIMRTLATLHAKDICHRNVKPKNIFVESSGRVRLIGLGLSNCKNAFFSPQLDAHAIGTPHFMAPEMIRGCCADPRSDLYSLGVTLYLMVAGRPPFEAGIPAAVMTRHLTETPKALAQLRADLSPEFVKMVHKLIARDPDQRYRSASEAADILESLEQKARLAAGGLVADPSASNRKTFPPLSHAPSQAEYVAARRSFHPILVASLSAVATVLLLVGLAFGIYSLWDHSPSERAAPVRAPMQTTLPSNLENSAQPIDPNSAEMREFARLEAQAAAFQAHPDEGIDAWAAYLNKFTNGNPTLQKKSRENLDRFLRLSFQNSQPVTPTAPVPPPHVPRHSNPNPNELEF